MKSVGDILRAKGHETWAIGPDASVFEALELMAEKDIGAVMVMDKGSLVGIMSERDYARKVILMGRFSRDTRVRDIMTEEVVYVRPELSLEQCMALMTEKRIRHLPVFEGESLVGVVSIGDIVKSIISDQGFIIEQLTNYISGRVR